MFFLLLPVDRMTPIKNQYGNKRKDFYDQKSLQVFSFIIAANYWKTKKNHETLQSIEKEGNAGGVGLLLVAFSFLSSDAFKVFHFGGYDR